MSRCDHALARHEIAVVPDKDILGEELQLEMATRGSVTPILPESGRIILSGRDVTQLPPEAPSAHLFRPIYWAARKKLRWRLKFSGQIFENINWPRGRSPSSRRSREV
jgi:hypothetical protein